MPHKRSTQGRVPPFAPVEAEIIEVLDEAQRPFMLMPRASALAQNLPHQVVLVVLRDREGQIYIHRRAESKKNYAGLWSVSASGLVKAGEAAEDAAMRELDEELGISGVTLTHAAALPPAPETDWGQINLFISSPSNVLVKPNPDEISEGMFVDEDELAGLLHDMPGKIAPALKWAAELGNLFTL